MALIASALSAAALLPVGTAQAAPIGGPMPMAHGPMISPPMLGQGLSPTVEYSQEDPGIPGPGGPIMRGRFGPRLSGSVAYLRALRTNAVFGSGYWTHTLPLTPLNAIANHQGRIGMIVTSVMIDGHGPFRFMLDTGATRTVLASATVAKLGLKLNPAEQIIVRGVSGRTTVPLVHVSSVVSGALELHDLSAPVLSGPIFNGLDGILGMDGLANMRLTADFVRDQVVISNSPAPTSTTAHPKAAAGALLLTTLQGQFVSQRLLLVHGRIDGVETAAVIDTGATRSLGNPALLALLTHGHPGAQPSAKNGVIDATATTEPGSLQRIASMRLGSTNITNLRVIFGNYPVFKSWGLQDTPAMLLGMDVLGSVADFSIDYGRAQLQVLPWMPPTGRLPSG